MNKRHPSTERPNEVPTLGEVCRRGARGVGKKYISVHLLIVKSHAEFGFNCDVIGGSCEEIQGNQLIISKLRIGNYRGMNIYSDEKVQLVALHWIEYWGLVWNFEIWIENKAFA